MREIGDVEEVALVACLLRAPKQAAALSVAAYRVSSSSPNQ